MQLQAIEAMRGKRALITGGSKGIGASIAETFASAGVHVGIVGRDREGLYQVKDKVEKYKCECIVIESDLSTINGVQAAGKAALSHAKNWDILVNNAGFVKSGPLLEIRPEDWDMTLNVNLRAALILSQLIVPLMIKHNRGKVINISSLGSFLGTPGLGAYAASKAGLNQLTRTMAVEWGPHNIQVNAICPTIIMTKLARTVWDDPSNTQRREDIKERIPMHRFGEPQEIADLALFLASPAANFITGVSIPVDGGKLVAP